MKNHHERPCWHGRPCWYELATTKGSLAEAENFYSKILAWEIQDSGMEGFNYHLAKSDEDMVAGMMEFLPHMEGMPPHWAIYFAVDDADRATTNITAAGGSVHKSPEDIPGTGRFAVVADPQGAVFYILQPLPIESDEGGLAFDPAKAGHGNWNELMSTDPEAGFNFYAKLFGWKKSQAMDMGEMGTYQLFSHNGVDIGGMMGLGNAPMSCWLPYFGVNGVTATMDRIAAAGGKIVHGPAEVPGGAFIAQAQDPQGAHFAIVGPKEQG